MTEHYGERCSLLTTGRSDYGVDPTSVDVSEDPPCSDLDDYEKAVSRQFAYFVRNVRNIRLISDAYIKLKKREGWALDKEFVAHNVAFQKWPDGLPSDFQLYLSPTGQVPDVPSHFLGNMHSHYHLGIVMLRRPQLKASENFGADSQWRHHMSVCYNSAKILCRLQEGILANFDLTGLLVMQRGINFTIYAILTCVMLHLVALSSPDPEFNFEAKDYFVRHMRILERCVSAWPMPETEAQINALRAAFSADVHKPFELKESFPHGTPSEHSRPSPVSPPSSDRPQPSQLQPQKNLDVHHPHQAQPNQYLPQLMNQMPRQQAAYLATPPVSDYTADSKPQTPMYAQGYDLAQQTSYANIPSSASGYYQQQAPSAAEIQWNPTPIMDQFDTAFAIPPAALAPPPSMYGGSGASPPGNMQSLHQSSFAPTSSPTYGTTCQSARLSPSATAPSTTTAAIFRTTASILLRDVSAHCNECANTSICGDWIHRWGCRWTDYVRHPATVAAERGERVRCRKTEKTLGVHPVGVKQFPKRDYCLRAALTIGKETLIKSSIIDEERQSSGRT